MSDILSELLTYLFEKEKLNWPESADQTLVYGSQYTPDLARLNNVDWIQNFKPYANSLAQKNIHVKQTLDKKQKYKNSFCVLPKQKEESLFILAACLDSLEENGLLIAVAANDAGGKRLDKWFLELGLLPNSFSKSKCRIVYAKKTNPNIHKIKEFLELGAVQKVSISNSEFFTKAGIYGWNKIDLGSKILTEILPNNLSGTGADFGSGYGYLSNVVLSSNKIKKLFVIDADYNAIECAYKNLEKYQANCSIEFLWEDLTTKPKELQPLDWIVMNPPFHEGKSTNIDVGQKFIETAAQSLRKGGVLYMVANAHLPYEDNLRKLFANVEKIIEKQGFKVFKAIK